MKSHLVRDWMSRDVIAVSPTTTMGKAHQLMQENDVRRLPVLKRRKLVGILSLGDVREASHELERLKVSDVMQPNVVAVSAEDTLKTAALLMYTNKIGALPVVDNHDRLVGIITESDIFKVLIAWFNEEEGS